MFEARPEPRAIENKIKNENPEFNKESFLLIIKNDVKNMYYAFKEKDNGKNRMNCTPKFIEKVMSNLEEFRINKDIDNIAINYVELYDYIEDECKIKIYMSVIFNDDTSNNDQFLNIKQKTWNDIWIVTYAKKDKIVNSNKCENCGADMEFDDINKLFKCEFCKNVRYFNNQLQDWIIDDIEVKK